MCATKLAYTTMVPHSKKTDEIQANHIKTNSAIASPTIEPFRASSPLPQPSPHGLSLISQKISTSDLSSSAQNILLSSWRPGTLKQYKSYLDRWQTFCAQNSVEVFNPTLEQCIEFLTTLFNSGLGYSAINTARSALSSVITLSNGLPIGEHPTIRRFLKGVFEIRPALPKYTAIWDVGKLLDYLKTFQSASQLSLKDLTHKTATLLFLLTGQRCQTIHSIELSGIQSLPDLFRITILQPVKTSKPGKHIQPLELKAFATEPNLCIVLHLSEYIKRTNSLRGSHTKLFLSHQKPHNPVSRDTISRWVKSTMKLAGIDTNVFTAHSCRSASTSAAKASGLSLSEIFKSAGWSNATTFARFYDKLLISENFGQSVLSNIEQ